MRHTTATGTITALTLTLVTLAGCQDWSEFRDADRAKRLMDMAGEEAGMVANARDRLSRQLNIADMELDNGHADTARKTLGQVRTTLTDAAKDLDEHSRIAGWVSTSELSRRAGDKPGAESAIDQAVKLLRELAPPASRAEYVRGVGDELKQLRGKPAAAALLRESTDWAASIEDKEYRRRALAAIASDLFGCDDYPGGREALRRDADPAWRTDTLTQLASNAIPQPKFLDPSEMTLGSSAFGKPVSYRETFQKSK